MNTPAIHNLPDEVKALSTFVLWVAVSDKAGATGKRPFDPWYKGRGNDDPTLHSLLPQALRTLQALPNKKLGLGLFQPAGGVRLGADGKSGYLHIIDLDGFVGPVSTAGKIKLLDLGWDIVELCQGSYFEVSPSGNGAKILMVSDLEPASKTSLALLKNERVPRRSGRSAKTVSKGSPHP
jgi:primase-polymerase (primpol)-like protein